MKKVFFSLLALMLMATASYAQRMVSGTITGPDGSGIIGANVVIKGTSIGTVTDANGAYSLNVPEGSNTILVSYTGFTNQELTLGISNVLNVSMSEGVYLQETVVTALGVSRDRASLGYAQQQVGGEEVNRVQTGNFINNLSGKVSGVQIRTNNNFGGSTNIVIRGNSSLTGNNQALFVIDGIPVDNANNNLTSQTRGRTGYDYGNAGSDINPNDIETMSVLKGAAATALYGSRAANGVILITTKKGQKNKGLGVSIASSFTVGNIDKSTFIKYQNKYGAGYGPYYGENADGYFEEYDIDGDGIKDKIVPTYDDASYGGKFDPNLNVYQWESFVPESDKFGKKYPYVAAANTPVEFFETESTLSNNVALTAGNDNGAFRMSYTNYITNGILPNSELKKNILGFSSSYELSKKLTAAFTGSYTHQNAVGRNSSGYSDNIMSNFRQWWQTNVDIAAQEKYYNLTGRNVTWNMEAPWDGKTNPLYWDNPYWARNENYESDSRNRIIGNVSLSYDLTDKINILGRYGLDNYNDLREERRAIGSVAAEFGVEPDGLNRQDESSGYQRQNIGFTETNFDLIGSYNTNISSNLSFKGLAGMNIRQSKDESIRASTSGGLVVPKLYALSNSVNPNPLPIERLLEKQVNGYYGSISLGFRNYLFLELMDRVDVASTLPLKNNTYNYYSISTGFVFSRFLHMDYLNFSKFRASYGEVGNDAPALSVYDTYQKSSNFGSSTVFSVPSTKNNIDLQPERTKSFELGLEMNFLDNRVGFDVSIYKNNTVDQILPVATSRSTGYSFKFVNAGEVENKGVELILNFNPVRMTNFKWNSSINFTKNKSLVVSLFDGINNLQLAAYQGGVSVNATIGEAYGSLRGLGYKYDSLGNKLVTATGYYAAVADQIIGNMNPDWIGGWSNTFTYKKLSLNFLVDVSMGGDVFSLDTYYGSATGLPDYTAELNDLGNPVRDPITADNKSGGILLDGVNADGTKNTKRIPATAYSQAFYWGNATRNPAQIRVYDASYVKLRELALSYSLLNGKSDRFFKGATLSIVGRNLWIIHKNLPFADPESGLTSGNAQGYSVGAMPTTRTIGASIKFDF
ncbi:MAG: SusC/RagA family TonB-linked outer membrane protein [Saprospiraceae bacterium]